MGGGAGISAFAPIIIATEKTLFAMPEAKLGFFTDVGINFILARLRNNIGHYLGMTGARLKGEDVFISGLAHFYIPSSKIPEARQEIFKFFGSK
jgi:3-hydroxyisobutyryl-CoA hydrolase